MRNMHITILLTVIIVNLFLLLIPDKYIMHILFMTFLYTYLGLSWGILTYVGQLSFGHAAFFAIGAYTSTILFIRLNVTPWIGMIFGGLIAGMLGIAIGYISLRIKGAYFSLTTIAFSQMIMYALLNLKEITKGPAGIVIPYIRGESGFIYMQFDGKAPYCLLISNLAILTALLIYGIRKSKIGYYMRAIASDEETASGLGINSIKWKVFAAFLSSFLTAFGGTIYAQYVLYIEPITLAGMNTSFRIIIVSLLGGLDYILGPFLGAFALIPTTEWLRLMFLASGGPDLFIFGIILIFLIILKPQGLGSIIEEIKRRIR
ncbi:MAG: branched-chain amino acid ABC transporter permease [Candidatus Micrarchaeia archaeon]